MPIIEAIEAVQSDKPSNDNTLSDAIAAKLNSKNRFSFNEMLAALNIQKNEKGGIGAQNQTQFEYVKQRIFELTGETWRWEGAPKDGYWVRDAIAATDNQEMTVEQAYELACSRGFTGKLDSFSQSFSRNEKTFGERYGLRRWKKDKGKTKPYFYSDIR